jgi:transposase-like protein
MKNISYAGYRFPPEIIQQAIWLYLWFTLSLRDVEDLLAERGISVSYETVCCWMNHFGPMIAADLRKRRPKGFCRNGPANAIRSMPTILPGICRRQRFGLFSRSCRK